MKNDPPIYTTTKLSNIPEKSLKHHNRKNTRAYDNRFRPNYDVTTSSLNIAIKSRKQPKHQKLQKIAECTRKEISQISRIF